MPAIHTLENQWLSLAVSEHGASITRLVFRPLNFPILRSSSDSEDVSMAGMFPLLPFVNRIAGNRFIWQGKEIVFPITQADEPYFLHGDGWLNQWQLRPMYSNAAQLCLHSESELAGTYHYEAQLIFFLEKDVLGISLQLTNKGRSRYPFGLGLHPFFQLLPTTQVHFAAEQIWFEDDHHISISPATDIPKHLSFSHPRTIPDDWLNYCYYSPQSVTATLDHPNGMTVKLTCDTHYLQIYKPQGQSDFLCLEPQSQFGNAHHDPNFASLNVLEPGQSMTLNAQIQCLEAIKSHACS